MECNHLIAGHDRPCNNCLKAEVATLQEKVDQQSKFIADTADNHIELCRSLGTHRPLHEAGCFGVSECMNCFKIGFAVLEHAKRRSKQLIDELAEINNLVTQYRVRLAAAGNAYEYEKEGHKKTAKQFVDATAVMGCQDIKIERLEATLDPVRDWYNGDGRVTDPVLMLSEAIADLQKDRKELIVLAAEHKELWDGHPPFQKMELKLRAADALAKAIDEWIEQGHLSSRSPIADARLDYGDPYMYRAKENAELSAAHVRITALEEDWKNAVEFIEYVRDSFHLVVAPEIREAARKVLEGEDW